jgi:hypothetical protein
VQARSLRFPANRWRHLGPILHTLALKTGKVIRLKADLDWPWEAMIDVDHFL